MSEEDRGARRKSLGFKSLFELVHGRALGFGVDAGGFPVGEAVLRDLLRVLLPSEGKEHGHSCELLKRACSNYT